MLLKKTNQQKVNSIFSLVAKRFGFKVSQSTLRLLAEISLIDQRRRTLSGEFSLGKKYHKSNILV